MKQKLFYNVLLLSIGAFLFNACNKPDDIFNPPPPGPPSESGHFPIRLKAVITIGEVVYDSIPATFTITTWNGSNVAQQKDTTLNPGAQIIYLPKAATRYSFKMNKWGDNYEKTINKSEITEGALYTIGGNKSAKKLQWVSEETFVNGIPSLSAKQHFIYDGRDRINEILHYAPDPTTGELRLQSSSLFMRDQNELWVNNIRKSNGVLFTYSAYTFDSQKRITHSKHQFLTETQFYTHHYTSGGIRMLMGKNATDPNGSRIELKFSGGNRTEEKTIIPNYQTAVKNYSYDFNINPYIIIKMPDLYFEVSSKNNVLAENWEGSDKLINVYKYDADGYVSEVLTKARSNNGEFVNFTRTTYTY